MPDPLAIDRALDTPLPGLGIQRTMALLASSTATRRNRVKILVYGQSLSKQEWWLEVRESLMKRFPYADLDMRNLAVGGFPSQRLVHAAEQDIYPAYPDLVIFRVSGDHRCYEQIVRGIRSRTCAEMLLWNDPPTWFPDGGPGDDKQMQGYVWSVACAYEIYPEVGRRYGCCFADTRSEWKEYLRAHRFVPHELMVSRTDSHMNKLGNHLLARLIGRRLYRDESLPMQQPVRDCPVGQGSDWSASGVLEMAFEGNRVDAVLGQGQGVSRVLVDGHPVSQTPSCYCFTRPNDIPGQDWPWRVGAMFRVDSQAPLTEEVWTATITEMDDACKRFRFTVAGSVTGDDGTGDSETRFISRSGRVVIEPEYWFLAQACELTKQPFAAGHRIEWRSRLMGTDGLRAPAAIDPAREHVVTLAQGLRNGPHTLRLEGTIPLQCLRVYRPPVPTSAAAGAA
jgi:hypothetical protein